MASETILKGKGVGLRRLHGFLQDLARTVLAGRLKSRKSEHARNWESMRWRVPIANFAAEASSGKYSFIIAGRNFGGGGKSIEHPIIAIKGAGVKAVIAESASRYFFRNAINNGLPILICEGITSNVRTGDDLEDRPL